MLKLSNDPNKSSITFDPRTCGAPNSILTNFLEPLAKGRPVEFKKLSDFVRIKLKL